MVNVKKYFKKNSKVLWGSSFFVGILFFCFYQEWIMVYISFGTQPLITLSESSTQKKSIALSFWKENKWQREEIEILWSSDTSQTLSYITNRWFSLLDEEEILDKKVVVQNVSLSQSGNQAYLSFDRYPFNRESSAFEKSMVIEGLLKTLKESGIKVLYFYFLVHHKPIQDYHLDFIHPWPLYGFLV